MWSPIYLVAVVNIRSSVTPKPVLRYSQPFFAFIVKSPPIFSLLVSEKIIWRVLIGSLFCQFFSSFWGHKCSSLIHLCCLTFTLFHRFIDGRRLKIMIQQLHLLLFISLRTLWQFIGKVLKVYLSFTRLCNGYTLF